MHLSDLCWHARLRASDTWYTCNARTLCHTCFTGVFDASQNEVRARSMLRVQMHKELSSTSMRLPQSHKVRMQIPGSLCHGQSHTHGTMHAVCNALCATYVLSSAESARTDRLMPSCTDTLVSQEVKLERPDDSLNARLEKMCTKVLKSLHDDTRHPARPTGLAVRIPAAHDKPPRESNLPGTPSGEREGCACRHRTCMAHSQLDTCLYETPMCACVCRCVTCSAISSYTSE